MVTVHCLKKTVNPLSADPTEWSGTLKQLFGKPTNCLSVLDHFVGLALTGI